MVMDPRTAYLNLPLPHEKNDLREDLPRLIAQANGFDAHAKTTDTALAARLEQANAADDAIAALEARATATEQAQGVTAATVAEQGQTLLAHAAAQEAEAEAREAADDAEATARQEADAAHEASTSAHAALFKHLATGSLSPVIGICLAEEGGGAGSWCHVDKDGLPVTPPRSYFDHHPTYKAIRRVLVDGQMMQEHSKFYYKAGAIASGPLEGKWARWISPDSLEGFKVFPSFLKAGQEIDHWYCATYQAIDTTPDAANAQKILGSRPGRQPFTNVDFPTMQAMCARRNSGGVTGFAMWDIYQVSEIQLLALLEAGTSDSQAFYGPGWVDGQWRVVSNVAQFDAKCVDDPTVASASWRGHVGLWGNVWQMVDGLKTRDSDKHIMIYKNDGSKAWIDTGIVAPERAKFGTTYTHAWPVNFRHQSGEGFDLADIFYPETLSTAGEDGSGGSVPDAYWGWQPDFGQGQDRVCYLGASWYYGSLAGLFALDLYTPASSAHISIGCRLARA